MSDKEFLLDYRLQADTQHIASLTLCDVLLMNDARFPWLILVPRQPSLVEVFDLTEEDRQQLWLEVEKTAKTLRQCVACDKVNIGALGNVVRQLHIHVVARVIGDAVWPAPVWGSGDAEPYSSGAPPDWVHALRVFLQSDHIV